MWDGSLENDTSEGHLSSDRAAAFYEQIGDAASITDKLSLLWDFAQNIGFTDIFYCKLNDPLSASPYNKSNIREYRFGDETWHNLYEEANYARFDWAIERATWAQEGFRLDELPANLSAGQEKFVAHAREYNRQNGFCLPLMDGAGLHGGFSATGCDRTPTKGQVMQMTSALQLTELTITAQQKSQTRAAHGLNEREIKDLHMLAAGRTMAQIAHITGKSDQWIRLSFGQIRTKLGVATNPQLVHRATKMGII